MSRDDDCPESHYETVRVHKPCAELVSDGQEDPVAGFVSSLLRSDAVSEEDSGEGGAKGGVEEDSDKSGQGGEERADPDEDAPFGKISQPFPENHEDNSFIEELQSIKDKMSGLLKAPPETSSPPKQQKTSFFEGILGDRPKREKYSLVQTVKGLCHISHYEIAHKKCPYLPPKEDRKKVKPSILESFPLLGGSSLEKSKKQKASLFGSSK